MRYTTLLLACWLAWHSMLHAAAADNVPLFRVVDLNRGEAAQITLSEGKKVNVKLLEVDGTHDATSSCLWRN